MHEGDLTRGVGTVFARMKHQAALALDLQGKVPWSARHMLDVGEGACSSAHPMPPLSGQPVPPSMTPQLTPQHASACAHTGHDGGTDWGRRRRGMGSKEP